MREATMSGSTRLNRKGATLPLTILLLALMGVAVAITFNRISSERRITGDSRAQLGAFAVAQSGLNRFLSTLNGKPAGPFPVTVSYNDLPGGSARVDLTQLRESTTTLLPALYSITSRGTYTAGRRYDALSPSAQRTVGTYALWTPAPFDLNGAVTSLSGLDKAGNSGALDGNDRCGAAGAIPGVAVPTGTFTGSNGPINGNPDNAPVYLGTQGTAGTFKDEVDIDWAGISAGTVLPPAFVAPAWPTAAQMNGWPVTKVNNTAGPDFVLPSSGKGILIVTGNLRINGAMPPLQWEGLVLVGGNVVSNGDANIYGALITALNIKLGVNVPQQSIANGTKVLQYDSCSLQRALGNVGSIQRVRNGWIDTWPSYQ
jgi:hypothetical protein